MLSHDRIEADARLASLQRRLNWTEAAIERLLDRLENDEAGESLLARLTSREAERDELRAEISENPASAECTKLPTAAELEEIYRRQVERLEHLLTGNNQMVAANTLLKSLLGEVRLFADEDARDGMAIEIRGDVSRILLHGPHKMTKGLPKEALSHLN